MKWKNTDDEIPRPYQIVEAKGEWSCNKVLYLDNQDDGWEQLANGEIRITHWKPRTKTHDDIE